VATVTDDPDTIAAWLHDVVEDTPASFLDIEREFGPTLAALVEAGVPILMSLEMTSEVAGNYVIEKAYSDMREAARRGQALGETVARTGVFPVMVGHMITIGEQTGRLEEMLSKVADWFEQELDEKIKRLTAVIEPLLIIFVGGIVALVASAIFLPIVGAIQAML